MSDQDIRKVSPLLPRECSHQVTLNHGYIISVRKPNPLCEPSDMRIDSNSVISSECVVEHNVCRFPADTGDFQQFHHRFWHVPLEF